jgi:hypothetical protein
MIIQKICLISIIIILLLISYLLENKYELLKWIEI